MKRESTCIARQNHGTTSETSAKKIRGSSWVIVGHGIGVSRCPLGVSQVSPGGLLEANFENTRTPRDAPDLPRLHRINPIPNVHFLTFFRDEIASATTNYQHAMYDSLRQAGARRLQVYGGLTDVGPSDCVRIMSESISRTN